jgi:hypothetical protein
MAYFAGLDVSVKETSVCIVDDAGKIVREVRVASEPEALLQVLTNTIYRFKRVGLEAGPLSQNSTSRRGGLAALRRLPIFRVRPVDAPQRSNPCPLRLPRSRRRPSCARACG